VQRTTAARCGAGVAGERLYSCWRWLVGMPSSINVCMTLAGDRAFGYHPSGVFTRSLLFCFVYRLLLGMYGSPLPGQRGLCLYAAGGGGRPWVSRMDIGFFPPGANLAAWVLYQPLAWLKRMCGYITYQRHLRNTVAAGVWLAPPLPVASDGALYAACERRERRVLRGRGCVAVNYGRGPGR